MRCPPIRSRAEYDRAFDVVRRVIHQWDPYGLLAGGATPDEWDQEIASLVAVVPTIRSADDAISAVSRVFSKAFSKEGFGLTDCANVGRRLIAELTSAGSAFLITVPA